MQEIDSTSDKNAAAEAGACLAPFPSISWPTLAGSERMEKRPDAVDYSDWSEMAQETDAVYREKVHRPHRQQRYSS